MALVYVFLFMYLMHKLGQKGKAYREEKRVANIRARKGTITMEDEYRKELKRQGYDDDLIAIILPVVMK